MIKLMVTIFMMAATLFAAQSYEEKLISLRTIIPVEFSHTLPYFEKHTGVDNLYSLVFDRTHKYHFGKDKTVRKVIISNNTPKYSVSLYDHTLVFDYTGKQTRVISNTFDRFVNELAKIAELKYQFSRYMNNLTFYRPLHGYRTTSNTTFLENLKRLQTSIKTSDRRYSAFDNIHQVVVKDTPSPSERTTISKKLVGSKNYLHITFARSGPFNEVNHVTSPLLSDLLDIITVYDFNSVYYSNLNESEVPAVIKNLRTALSEYNNYNTLYNLGVRHLVIDKSLDYARLSNSGKTLTVGPSLQVMRDGIYKLLNQ